MLLLFIEPVANGKDEVVLSGGEVSTIGSLC